MLGATEGKFHLSCGQAIIHASGYGESFSCQAYGFHVKDEEQARKQIL
jgi:hypothetical protein